MKRVLYISVLSILFLACERDTITRSVSEAELRQEQLVEDLKHALHSAEDGWVMMVKNNLSSRVAVPVVIKFDTVRNRTDIVTVYGITDMTESYFRIERGVSHPLLTFTTGSAVTALYRLGATASDLTDHIFKVLAVEPDTITIQCYRGGGVYSAEGGAVYRLFKRPKAWKWADKVRYFDLDAVEKWQSSVFNIQRPMTVHYIDGTPDLTTNVRFTSISNSLLTTLRRNDPFVRDISAHSFVPFHIIWLYFSKENNMLQTSIMIGHNSLSFYPFSVNQNVTTSTHVLELINHIGTNYLIAKEVVQNGNEKRIDFVAYDSEGRETLMTRYGN